MSTTSPSPSPSVELAYEKPSQLANYINLAMIPIALATTFMVFVNADTPVRVWFAVLLFIVGPGSALTQFFRLPDQSLQLGLIFAISGAVAVLIGQSFLWVHNMSGTAAVCIVAGLTCIRPVPVPHAPPEHFS